MLQQLQKRKQLINRVECYLKQLQIVLLIKVQNNRLFIEKESDQKIMKHLKGSNRREYSNHRHKLQIQNHQQTYHYAFNLNLKNQTVNSSSKSDLQNQKSTKISSTNNLNDTKLTPSPKTSPKDTLISTKNQNKITKNNTQQKQNLLAQQQNTKPKCRKRKVQQQTKVNNKKQQKIKTQTSRKSIKPVKLSQQEAQISEKNQGRITIQQPQQKFYQELQDTQANSEFPYCDQLQQSSGVNIPWVPILFIILGILLIAFIIWLVNTIRKRINTTKQYNQTPQNFIQKPTLSLNQSKNLKLHTVKSFSNYKQLDVLVQNKTQFGGNIYQLKFMNAQSKNFSAAYWSKALKTDCYFQIQIQTLHSQIQFGFVNKKYISLLDSGVQTKIRRVGVSLNSQGNLQLFGQIKYQYRWNLEYGDVIGLGITELDKMKRVWVTKNGILLNPPTSDEVDKWLSKESLSQQHKDAYYSLTEQGKNKNLNRKQDSQLLKKRITLPVSEDFQYYAVVGSLEMKQPSVKKNKKSIQKNMVQNNSQKLVTVVRFNVGGKTFRLRDHNLRSGLLADSIEKNQFCNWLPCF